MPLLLNHKTTAGKHILLWRCDENVHDLVEILRRTCGNQLADKYKKEFSDFKAEARQIERLAARIMFHLAYGNSTEIVYLPSGRPTIKVTDKVDKCSDKNYGCTQEPTISISHTKGYVAIAISPQLIGIDIEQKSDRALRVASRFLSEEERSIFVDNATSEAQRQITATTLWSAKEAAFKFAQQTDISVMDVILHAQPLRKKANSEIFLLPTLKYLCTLNASAAGKEPEVMCYEHPEFILTLAI